MIDYTPPETEEKPKNLQSEFAKKQLGLEKPAGNVGSAPIPELKAAPNEGLALENYLSKVKQDNPFTYTLKQHVSNVGTLIKDLAEPVAGVLAAGKSGAMGVPVEGGKEKEEKIKKQLVDEGDRLESMGKDASSQSFKQKSPTVAKVADAVAATPTAVARMAPYAIPEVAPAYIAYNAVKSGQATEGNVGDKIVGGLKAGGEEVATLAGFGRAAKVGTGGLGSFAKRTMAVASVPTIQEQYENIKQGKPVDLEQASKTLVSNIPMGMAFSAPRLGTDIKVGKFNKEFDRSLNINKAGLQSNEQAAVSEAGNVVKKAVSDIAYGRTQVPKGAKLAIDIEGIKKKYAVGAKQIPETTQPQTGIDKFVGATAVPTVSTTKFNKIEGGYNLPTPPQPSQPMAGGKTRKMPEKPTGISSKDIGAEDVKIDNPGGKWLEQQKQRALEARQEGYSSGSATADIRKVNVPVDELLKLEGLSGEHLTLSMQDPEIIKLAESIKKEGLKNPPFINVEFDGKASINEGNHRIRAAKLAGLKTIPVDIRYFAGGELENGPMSFDNLKRMTKVEESPLHAEARKYKSAEEFVNAQGETFWHGGFEFDPSQFDKTVGLSVSPFKQTASEAASGQKGSKLYPLKIKPSAKIGEYKDLVRQSNSIDNRDIIAKANELGYDAINWDGDEIRILNPDIIKTKSQLTDIWNEANGQKSIATVSEQISEPIRQARNKVQRLAKDLGVELEPIEFSDIEKPVDPKTLEGVRWLKEFGLSTKEIQDAIESGKKFVVAGEHILNPQGVGQGRSRITLYRGHDIKTLYHEFAHAVEEQGGLPGWAGTKEQHAQYLEEILNRGEEASLPEFRKESSRIIPGSTITKDGTFAVNNSIRTVEDTKVHLKMLNNKTKWFKPEEINKYFSDLDNVTAFIIKNKDILDYKPAKYLEALKANSDKQYQKSLDFTTMCVKRYIMQSTVDKIQTELGRPLLAEEFMEIRAALQEKGVDTSCGACYVDSRRINMATVINKALNGYIKKPGDIQVHNENGDLLFEGKKSDWKKDPNFTTEDGLTITKIFREEHIPPLRVPKEYLLTMDGVDKMAREFPEEYQKFRKLFGGTQMKIPEARTEYRGDILEISEGMVKNMNTASGLRWQSWSDFEMPHLLDAMQAVGDMSIKQLKGHAYTKQTDFVRVMAPTGIMINMSLIPKGTGFDAKGNLIFDETQSFPFDDAMMFRKQFPNVGTVAIGISDAHIAALLKDPRIDYVIPYHASGLSKVYAKKIGMSGWKDYSKEQNWTTFKTLVHDDKGKLIFSGFKEEWINSPHYGREDVAVTPKGSKVDDKIFIAEFGGDLKMLDQLAQQKGIIPPFSRMRNLPGYEKLITDRRIYDNEGRFIEQEVVRPNFDMNAIQKLLKEYKSPSYEPDQEVVDAFIGKTDRTQRSLKEVDPTEEFIKTIEPSKGLSPEHKAIEDKFIERIRKLGIDNVMADYDSKFKNVANTDLAREFSEDYMGNKALYSAPVHEPASAIAKLKWTRDLAKEPVTNTAMLIGGGTGAGKTSGVKNIPGLKNMMDNSDAVFDTNLNGFKSSVEKVEQALATGREVVIVGVFRDPVEAMLSPYGSALSRAMKPEDGRSVPVENHIGTHKGFSKTIEQLYEKYKDNQQVEFHFVDNSLGKGNAEEKPLDLLVKKTYSKDWKEIENEITTGIDKAYYGETGKPGWISEAVYRGTRGKAPERRVEVPGSDNRGEGGYASEGIPPEPEPQRPDFIEGLKERAFVTRVKEAFPKLRGKVEGQYVPRDTDTLSVAAKNLIYTDLKQAEKVAGGTDDKAVATASELIKFYNRQAELNPKSSEVYYDRAATVANDIAEKLTELGRAVQAASILTRLTPEGALSFAAREIQRYNEKVEQDRGGLFGLKKKIPELTGQEYKTLLDKFKEIQAMPEGVDKAVAYKNFYEGIQNRVPSSLYDRVLSLWKAGLLTGLKTSGLNVGSNLSHFTLEMIKDIPATAVDSVASLFTGKRTTALTGRGTLSGAKEGFQKGWTYLKTGYDERNSLVKLDYKKVNFGNSKIAKALQKYEETVFKIIGSEDQPFYYGAKARSLYSQAIAQGKNSKLKGNELKSFVENLVKNPTDEMLRYSVNDAEIAVFQNRTLLGAAAKGIQQIPGGEIVVPFGRTPASVATQVFNYSPVGIVSTIARNIGKGRFDQRDFSHGIGRGLTGTSLIGIGIALGAAGLTSLTYPTTEKEKKVWELEGRTPGSIYIGGKYRNANILGPAGSVILVGAAYQKALKETGSPSQAMGVALLSGAKSLTEQSFLRGLNSFLSALNDPDRYSKALFKSLIGSTIPTIIGDVAKTIDPVERRAEGWMGGFKAKVPGLRQTLQPRINALGKPVSRAGNIFETIADPSRPSRNTSNDVVKEIRRLWDNGYKLDLAQVGEKEGYDVLTPEQNTKLWVREGDIFNFFITDFVANPDYHNPEIPDELREKELNKILSKAGVEARAELYVEIMNSTPDDQKEDKMLELYENKFLTNDVFEASKKITGEE